MGKEDDTMKASIMTGLITGASLLLVVGMVVPAIEAETVLLPTQGNPTVIKFMGGTIEDVDPAGLKITITTDMGKKVSFPVSNPEVIRGLTKGDQVSVELDEQGKVLKVVKNNSAPKPAPEPRS